MADKEYNNKHQEMKAWYIRDSLTKAAFLDSRTHSELVEDIGILNHHIEFITTQLKKTKEQLDEVTYDFKNYMEQVENG